MIWSISIRIIYFLYTLLRNLAFGISSHWIGFTNTFIGYMAWEESHSTVRSVDCLENVSMKYAVFCVNINYFAFITYKAFICLCLYFSALMTMFT